MSLGMTIGYVITVLCVTLIILYRMSKSKK